jgi:flavin reductase (DIM6/NTAB) family NADH-FMN oxidoreductase RutF
MQYSFSEILNLNDRFRRNLINSISGFKSVSLIGTVNNSGTTNLAIFSQILHIGANPPMLGVLFRPDSVERHTLENIRQNRYFTINQIQESFYQQAHQTSARYSSNISEFDVVGLTPEFIKDVDVPFVRESNIKILLKCADEQTLKVNGTILLIGEIQELIIPDTIISDDGFVDLQKAGTITSAGLDAYYTTEKINRLSYAKVDLPITVIQ